MLELRILPFLFFGEYNDPVLVVGKLLLRGRGRCTELALHEFVTGFELVALTDLITHDLVQSLHLDLQLVDELFVALSLLALVSQYLVFLGEGFELKGKLLD